MMGYLLRRNFPVAPVVTRNEYLDVVDRAFDSLSRRRRGAAYQEALEDLVASRPVRAARVFASLLARRPDDPTLHRMLGISYFHAGKARLAACHFEIALRLLAQATTPGCSLLRSLRIEFEASVVRLVLVAAYEQLGHRAGMIRCLLAQNQPLAWEMYTRPGA
jgi:hypothetical protein